MQKQGFLRLKTTRNDCEESEANVTCGYTYIKQIVLALFLLWQATKWSARTTSDKVEPTLY